jgi:hypothetical protein
MKFQSIGQCKGSIVPITKGENNTTNISNNIDGIKKVNGHDEY